MTVNKFQTEWIVAHLLFPNSAQAREIYLYITAQILNEKRTLDLYEKNKLIFKIVIDIFRKTHVIQSGQSFAEFNQTQFKLWSKFYKKLTKDEILLTIAVVFLELKLTDIAIQFRLSSNQIENKFTQIISKLITKPQPIQNKQYEFKFRSMNKFETSDFVFYDNIIQGVFGLGHISFADLKNDLIADSRLHLRKYFESLADFKDELSSLSQQSYQPLEPQVQAAIEHQAKFISFKNFTVFLPTSFVTISILVLLFLRPQFIQDTFSSGKTETIKIQQIKIDRHLAEKDQPIPNAEQVIANTENTAKPADFANTVKSKNSPIASTALTIETIKSDQKPPIFAEFPQDKLKVIAASSGGLFRGRLIVTDVQQVIGVVREKIINLGGKKAGEVELGWMKNETTSYFHFSFPEENNTDLENYLKQFGKVQLVFEPHPRMMPKGIKRYIIEIKQNE